MRYEVSYMRLLFSIIFIIFCQNVLADPRLDGLRFSLGLGYHDNNTTIKNNNPSTNTFLDGVGLPANNSEMDGYVTNAGDLPPGTADFIQRAVTQLNGDDENFSGNLSVGKDFDLKNKYFEILGLDFEIDFPESKKITKNSDYTLVEIADGGGGAYLATSTDKTQQTIFEKKHGFSIGVQPTKKINEKLYLFGDLRFFKTKMNLDVKFEGDEARENYSNSEYVDGIGLGAGARYFKTKNLFFDFSMRYIDYEKFEASRQDNDITSAQLDTTLPDVAVALVGLTNNTNTLKTTVDNDEYMVAFKVGYKF